MAPTLPTPPVELASRIGGPYDEYHSIGALQRSLIDMMLPADWSYADKTVLDFGCGTGRTLAAFAAETDVAQFVGCDIHGESIAWAQREMSPPYEFFLCQETPPLDQPDNRFDLIYAMSVFTHITQEWANWLTELHRVMRPDALAIISVLGPAMAQQVIGHDWDDRIGMTVVDMHKEWSIGGPSVLISEWWLREHWGRAFEILRFQPSDVAAGPGHDLALVRRREIPCSPALLAARDAADARELEALECNLELLLVQQEQLGQNLRALRVAHSSDPGRRANGELLRRASGLLRRRRDA
ncbi:MAG: class I SAM-dependent methyltransferase [Actinomycetota bacterium]|nr:class I SAM-dependent methyltransferase [Actinomycetota bacterium]